MSAMKLQIRMRSPESYVPNPDYPIKSGDKYLMVVNPEDLFWKDAPEWFVKLDPSQCEHSVTACNECVETWQLDYQFRYVVEGTASDRLT